MPKACILNPWKIIALKVPAFPRLRNISYKCQLLKVTPYTQLSILNLFKIDRYIISVQRIALVDPSAGLGEPHVIGLTSLTKICKYINEPYLFDSTSFCPETIQNKNRALFRQSTKWNLLVFLIRFGCVPFIFHLRRLSSQFGTCVVLSNLRRKRSTVVRRRVNCEYGKQREEAARNRGCPCGI